MVRGQGIDAAFDIGEVLPEQGGHVRIETFAVGHRRVGMGPWPRAVAGAPACLLGKPPHDQGVPDIPGDARQLARAISDAGGKAGGGIGHAALPLRPGTIPNMGSQAGDVYGLADQSS